MLFMRRRRNEAVPEVGAEAPEFNLPSAQGGQLRLSMRTARGPVVVVFFRGAWFEEDAEYFQDARREEDEMNLRCLHRRYRGPRARRGAEFARESGIKSMVLYDYARVTTRQWGLSERDKEHGEYARPAVFIVGTDQGRPRLDRRSPRGRGDSGEGDRDHRPPEAAEEEEEKPQEATEGGEKPKKMSAEERERIKAERRAAREAGKSIKTPSRNSRPKASRHPRRCPRRSGSA